MAFKAVLLCVIAVISQSLAVSCYRKSIPASSCGCGSNRASTVTKDSPVYYESAVSEDYQSYKPIAVSASPIIVSENGGTMMVTSIGPIAPSGIAVTTDLGLAGELVLAGELPYLAGVAFEGQFDTSGAAAVAYGCGDGCIAITEQIGGNAGAGGYSTSLSGCGCGKY